MWTGTKIGEKLLARNFCGIRYYYKRRKMVLFNSIIIFDTETTGLPHLEGNDTRITELALIGCEIDHLKNTEDLPRVLHKLVFCFNPMKMVQPGSTDISGLNNELLMNIKPFSMADAEVLTRFINRLPSPVCIVAHNGNKFDFPILQKQFLNLNFKLPDDVYCADSLKAFHDIYPSSKDYFSSGQKKSVAISSYEVTPPKNKLSRDNEDFQAEFNALSHKQKLSVSKNLFPEIMLEKNNYSFNDGNKEGLSAKKAAPLNYKLCSIYEFLHGKRLIENHRAEEDCKALLSCIMKCDRFLSWMNEKAVSFNNIKPLL